MRKKSRKKNYAKYALDDLLTLTTWFHTESVAHNNLNSNSESELINLKTLYPPWANARNK